MQKMQKMQEQFSALLATVSIWTTQLRLLIPCVEFSHLRLFLSYENLILAINSKLNSFQHVSTARKRGVGNQITTVASRELASRLQGYDAHGCASGAGGRMPGATTRRVEICVPTPGFHRSHHPNLNLTIPKQHPVVVISLRFNSHLQVI
jgi:hypothetical protein